MTGNFARPYSRAEFGAMRGESWRASRWSSHSPESWLDQAPMSPKVCGARKRLPGTGALTRVARLASREKWRGVAHDATSRSRHHQLRAPANGICHAHRISRNAGSIAGNRAEGCEPEKSSSDCAAHARTAGEFVRVDLNAVIEDCVLCCSRSRVLFETRPGTSDYRTNGRCGDQSSCSR